MRLRPEGAEPWIPRDEYAAQLPPLSVNLLVWDIARSCAFYADVMAAEVLYQDVDFAAIRLASVDVMLHADHTHLDHPWVMDEIAVGATRGVGAQFRLLGIDPDAVEARARNSGARVAIGAVDRPGHGWREVIVHDPDGYEWACGVLLDPRKRAAEHAR